MKKFWKYFLITILLLIGLACIGILYLFFVPGASLFNITYISLGEKDNASAIFKMNSGFTQLYDSVEITSLNYDIELSTLKNASGVTVEVDANSFGFVLTKNKAVDISGKIEGGILKIVVTEPHGWAVKNKSKISVSLPASHRLNLTLNNTGATTTVTDAFVEDFYYNTQHGTLNFNSGNVLGDINLNLNSATANFNNAVKLNNNNVNLKMTSGKFNAAGLAFNRIEVLANKTGSVIAGQCNRLESDVKTSGGRVVIDTVLDANFWGADTDITVQQFDGTINLTRAGDVNIKSIPTVATISSVSGNISIEDAAGLINLTTENSGSITVKKAHSSVEAKSEYGDISVSFDEEDEHQSNSGALLAFVGKTANGKITVKNVENVKIEISDRGRANVYMSNVYGENSIKGAKGDVYIEVKEFDIATAPTGHAHYKLTATGVVNLNLQSLSIGGYTGTLEEPVYVNCNESNFDSFSNTLSVEIATGSLKIRDSRTYNK